MTRFLQAAVFAVAFAGASGASAADVNWDGTWSGSLGKAKPWPMTVVITQGKVVQFSERGVPFDVRFSKETPNGIVFGDGANYQVELKRSGADGVLAKVHGRLGIGPAHLTRS
jgi:hypothetical protein